MSENLLTWEYPFLYKVSVFMENSHLMSEVSDLVHKTTAIHPIVGASINSLCMLRTYSSLRLRRCFSLSPSSMQLAYTPGLCGGCGQARASNTIVKVVDATNPSTSKHDMSDRNTISNRSVQHITVTSNGVYEFCFYMLDKNGFQTESSEYTPLWKKSESSIDMAYSSFAVGIEVTAVLNALLGDTKDSDQKVVLSLTAGMHIIRPQELLYIRS